MASKVKLNQLDSTAKANIAAVLKVITDGKLDEANIFCGIHGTIFDVDPNDALPMPIMRLTMEDMKKLTEIDGLRWMQNTEVGYTFGVEGSEV